MVVSVQKMPGPGVKISAGSKWRFALTKTPIKVDSVSASHVLSWVRNRKDSAFASKVFFPAALPPDVRRGSASPEPKKSYRARPSVWAFGP